ncbi:MAG: hypothetical protein JRF47_18190 [Deltaproteobacteria bacterium]|nr:hypothetical protein [Deltaproteobacteria bacterium]
MEEFGTLVKFGQQDHLLQLQDEGLLYLNHLPYFWEIEDQELRGDPFDSIAEVRRGPKVVIPLQNGKEVSMEGEWIMRLHPPVPKKINIFCMYALRPFNGTFPVDERNFRFGAFAMVLINRPEFMRRIESTLSSQRIRCKADLVEYVDNLHIGRVGPFRKLKRFAYQSEWRLVCYDGPGGPRKIRIGSIRDISVILHSNEINEEIKIETEQPLTR